MGRDLRLDFFRGYALLIILYNHLLESADFSRPFFLEMTPYHMGFSGSAEIFVFISGYVFAIVYGRTLDRSRLSLTWARSCHRASQLYVANAFTYLVSMAAIALVAILIGKPHLVAWNQRADELLRLSDLLGVLTFTDLPALFDILKLYILILLVAPLLLYGLRRWPWIVGLVCLSGWLAAQRQWTVPGFIFTRGGGLHPLGWQLVFVGGMATSMGILTARLTRRGATIAAAFVAVSAVWVWAPEHLAVGVPAAEALRLLTRSRLADIELLGPLRIVHFAALVYLVAWLLRGRTAWPNRPWARPIVVTGQQSLEVFCFGLVYTYVGSALVQGLDWSWPGLVAVQATGVALSVGFAYLIRARKAAPWKPSPPKAPPGSAVGIPSGDGGAARAAMTVRSASTG